MSAQRLIATSHGERGMSPSAPREAARDRADRIPIGDIVLQVLGVMPGFKAWRASPKYVTARTRKVGPQNANHLIEPAEGRRATDSAPAADN